MGVALHIPMKRYFPNFNLFMPLVHRYQVTLGLSMWKSLEYNDANI